MGSSKQNALGKDLVQGCLVGKAQAWERLEELIGRISLFRVYEGKHSEQAEETADQVLFALWWKDYHILRNFDPAKGSLENYLTAVVKRIAQHSKRRERLEKGTMREYAAEHPSSADETSEQALNLTLEELSKRLKGELKRYFRQTYLGIFEGKPKEYNKEYSRKLEERLRKEWKEFFSEEQGGK